MFQKILIANRGEIAVRVIRACRRLRVRAAAVYSEADAEALHVRMADEAYPIGPAAPGESYLNAENILRAAKESGAEAVHPGYGFLSEQEAFAEACEREGFVFVGPAPGTLRVAGDKAKARAAAEAAGVPVVPGSEPGGAAALRAAAERLGYPLLVKAAAGGGGRGMRRAAEASRLEEACRAARAEAELAFGDGRIYLEKLLPAVRHVEVQILGDGAGEAIHLGERECSVQRRHQKVIEESPASRLPQRTREALCAAAVRLARSLRYRSAGTVEFLLAGEAYYFLEVNARLQVEHPVTEMVTGIDLVVDQLRIAAEGKLPRRQEEVRSAGHALEARLYAEDPGRDFRPQTGTVRAVRWPAGGGVRVDAGVGAGERVGADYDPLLAKVIAWGADRRVALRRLSAALAELQIAGVRTNQSFLAAVVDHPALQEGGVSTEFLFEHPEVLEGNFPEERLPDARRAAALGLFLSREGRGGGGPPSDPWRRLGDWLPGGLT